MLSRTETTAGLVFNPVAPDVAPTGQPAQTNDTVPLRLITCGSVDDGKSTLIGRLLWDTKSISSDHAEGLATSAVVGEDGEKLPEFALLLDGLQAEREQGITIDVAYRYFATQRRSFIIADTPGHEQYTRNMATGCSTADLAIVLVDARAGILEQTRRHATIVALMGIRQLVLVVNKMDLVDYRQSIFDVIVSDFKSLAATLGVDQVTAIPVSALRGHNVVVGGSAAMPWYHGSTLLSTIEVSPVRSKPDPALRFPVQRVSRPDETFRGYQGTVAGGTIEVGQQVSILPGGRSAKVQRIVSFDGDLAQASTGDAVTLVLDRQVDIARGDMLAPAGSQPLGGREFSARVVSLAEQGLHPGHVYWLKSGSKTQKVTLRLKSQLDLQTGVWADSSLLAVNGIGEVNLLFEETALFDPYGANRQTGSFILIDVQSNNTVAAGMIVGVVDEIWEQQTQDEAMMVLTLPAGLAESLLASDLLAPHRQTIGISRSIEPKSVTTGKQT